MKSILIIILFSSKILFAQQISYFRQHTNDIIECLFKKPIKIEMASHQSKCMKGKVFPEFCIEDRNCTASLKTGLFSNGVNLLRQIYNIFVLETNNILRLFQVDFRGRD